MKKTFLCACAVAGIASGLSASALAQTTTVKLGWVNVNPHSSALPMAGPFTPADTLGLEVHSKSTLFFSAARDISSNVEIELAMGVPPTHDISLVVLNPSGVPGSVAAMDGQIASRVRQVAPTLFANYKWGDSASQFRPFAGLGINFTHFDKTESLAVNDAVNGGPTTINLTNSWGLAAQFGVVAKLGGPWSLTGAWSTARVKTHLTTNTLGVERNSDITFHPSVTTIALGYSF
jgi:outer membrane protein